MLCPRHNVDHVPARAQHPAELLLCKGRKAVQQHVCPAGAHRLAEAGRHRILRGGQRLCRQPHRGLCDIEPGQLQRLFCRRELLRDAAVVPALAAACVQQMQRGVLRGGHAVGKAQLPQRLPENAVISGVQEGAAGSYHLLAVPGGFGSHTLHRQKMPVALPGAVKTVAFFTFQVILPLQRAAAQGALPRGKGFVPAHTSSL